MTTTHVADREMLAQLDARVEINGSTGEHDARPVLEAGRHGLEYFREFGPPYARFTGRPHNFRRDFLRRYESHADIAFGPLREDGERFAAVDRGLADNAVALRTQGESVFSSWQGGAADSAAAELAGLVAKTGTLRERFARLSKVVGEVADGTDRAVHWLANATSKLYDERVDGHDAADVRFLVAFYRRAAKGDDVDDDELARAAKLCRVAPRHRHALLADVTVAANAWLRGVFVPAYEAKVAAFHRICDTADEKLSSCWRRLGDVLESLLDPGPEPEKPVESGVRTTPPEGPAAATPVNRAAAPASGGSVSGGGVPSGGHAGGPAAAPPLAPGTAVGGVPAAQPAEESGHPGAQRPAANGAGAAAGLFGGMPMLGGAGHGDVQQRHTVDVPLAGLDLTNGVADAGFVIGGRDDQVAYNDSILEEADAARRQEESVPVAGDEPDSEDDLW